MAVAADFPYLDDPRDLIGRASYRLTADEIRAAARADLAHQPWCRSWPGWLAFFGFWHAILIASVCALIAAVRGLEGPFGPVDKGVIPFAVISAYIAGLVLWKGLYTLPAQIRTLYQKHPLADAELTLAFTANRWMFHGPMTDSSFAWEFLRDVFEFEDGFGFRLKIGPGTVWLPDHALAAPFNHHAAAELFREKVSKYRVVPVRAGKPAEGFS